MMLMRVLPIAIVPLIMLILSIMLPTLANPIFLLLGAVVGFFVGRYWVAHSGTRPGT